MLSANSTRQHACIDGVRRRVDDQTPIARVARRGAGRGDQDRDAAAPAIGERSVEQEREAVDDRADRVDVAELLAGDQRSGP